MDGAWQMGEMYYLFIGFLRTIKTAGLVWLKMKYFI
jgi:hypothetical protein